MIAASAGVKVMVATRPVDFRKGADGLAALVREQLRHDIGRLLVRLAVAIEHAVSRPPFRSEAVRPLRLIAV